MDLSNERCKKSLWLGILSSLIPQRRYRSKSRSERTRGQLMCLGDSALFTFIWFEFYSSAFSSPRTILPFANDPDSVFDFELGTGAGCLRCGRIRLHLRWGMQFIPLHLCLGFTPPPGSLAVRNFSVTFWKPLFHLCRTVEMNRKIKSDSNLLPQHRNSHCDFPMKNSCSWIASYVTRPSATWAFSAWTSKCWQTYFSGISTSPWWTRYL